MAQLDSSTAEFLRICSDLNELSDEARLLAHSSQPSMKFLHKCLRFFDLPAEIRVKIYSYVLPNRAVAYLPNRHDAFHWKHEPSPFLSISKATRKEVIKLWYERSLISIRLDKTFWHCGHAQNCMGMLPSSPFNDNVCEPLHFRHIDQAFFERFRNYRFTFLHHCDSGENQDNLTRAIALAAELGGRRDMLGLEIIIRCKPVHVVWSAPCFVEDVTEILTPFKSWVRGVKTARIECLSSPQSTLRIPSPPSPDFWAFNDFDLLRGYCDNVKQTTESDLHDLASAINERKITPW